MLGGMAELGQESLQEHEAIIELIKQHPWKGGALVGGDFLKLDHPFIKKANSAEACVSGLKGNPLMILTFSYKRVASMAMEKVLSSQF